MKKKLISIFIKLIKLAQLWLVKNGIWLGSIAALATVLTFFLTIIPKGSDLPIDGIDRSISISESVIDFKNGFTLEEYENSLRKREIYIKEQLLDFYAAELDRAHERTTQEVEKRILLEAELISIQEKLDQTETSYQEVIVELNSARNKLSGLAVHVELRTEMISFLLAAIQGGFKVNLDELPDVDNQSSKSVAALSYETGRLAELAGNIVAALSYYQHSVFLDENNQSYLQAESRLLTRYTEIVENTSGNIISDQVTTSESFDDHLLDDQKQIPDGLPNGTTEDLSGNLDTDSQSYTRPTVNAASARASQIKIWRSKCSEPDTDRRISYIKAAVATTDLVVKRICIKLALFDTDITVRGLGLNLALTSTNRLRITFQPPEHLLDEIRASRMTGVEVESVMRNYLYIAAVHDATAGVILLEPSDVQMGDLNTMWFFLDHTETLSPEYIFTLTQNGTSLSGDGIISYSGGSYVKVQFDLDENGRLIGSVATQNGDAFPASIFLF